MPLSTVLGPYSLHQITQRGISDGQKHKSISIFCTDRVAYPAKDAETNFERRMKLPALKFRLDLKLNIHLIKKIPLLLPTCSNLQNYSAPFHHVVQFAEYWLSKIPSKQLLIPQRTSTMVLSKNTHKALKSVFGRKLGFFVCLFVFK